jgi:hypothetical protein
MQRILLPLLSIFFVLISCGRKFYSNGAGFERPVRKNIFNYANRFRSFPNQVDTNAIYVHHCLFQTGGGMRFQYSYFRFFSDGQVLYVASGSELDLSHLDNLDKGIIGRYYIKNDNLRIQLFYNPGTFYSIVKFRGYFYGDSLFMHYTTSTPSSWCSTGNLENVFDKKFFIWEKQKVTFKSAKTPTW